MKKAGLFSGGGAYGAWLVGVHSELKIKYDVYIGSSTGALVALFLALARIDPVFFEILVYEYSNTTNRQMYGWLTPYLKSGKLNRVAVVAAFANMIRRKERNYLWDIGPELERKIRKYFTYEHFIELRKRGIDVKVTVRYINIPKQRTKYVSVLEHNMTYDWFIDSVVASCSIPYLAAPVDFLGTKGLDGGITDSEPTAEIKKYDSADVWLMHSPLDDKEGIVDVGGWSKKLASALLTALRFELRMDNLKEAKNAEIYYARHIEWSAADFNKNRMRALLQQGVEDAQRHDFIMVDNSRL